MGSEQAKSIDMNDIQVFYDDDDYVLTDEHEHSPVKVEQSEFPDRNEMLWSYAKDNKIVMFMHMKPGSDIRACINLRQKIIYPTPMVDYEYRSPYNEYCSCIVYDLEKGNFTLMGFILYRTSEKKLYLLDIVFCLEPSIWDEMFPELHGINIPLTCINAFHNFVISSGYKCIWRKKIILDRVFKKKLGVNRPRQYKSVGIQKSSIGAGKTKLY